MSEPEEMAYVAFKPCGCVSMATMETVSIAPREVAKAIKLGERVERMTAEAVRGLSFRCSECKKPQKAGKP